MKKKPSDCGVGSSSDNKSNKIFATNAGYDEYLEQNLRPFHLHCKKVSRVFCKTCLRLLLERETWEEAVQVAWREAAGRVVSCKRIALKRITRQNRKPAGMSYLRRLERWCSPGQRCCEKEKKARANNVQKSCKILFGIRLVEGCFSACVLLSSSSSCTTAPNSSSALLKSKVSPRVNRALVLRASPPPSPLS
jgi:hypothetical protein